tara:strand:- start:25966 stop:26082 length:117 start_codon:yes stop_codon:yes gene_type:complete
MAAHLPKLMEARGVKGRPAKPLTWDNPSRPENDWRRVA